jgi:hypothetical protein
MRALRGTQKLLAAMRVQPAAPQPLARFFVKYDATVRYRGSPHILRMVVAELQHPSIGILIAA